ncbi:MAG: tRNA 2-thiouridine(34) synthase MnmA [Armatimonadetes bacterium]|nr:tRNA 2-thiouridine(34) synthase MnmA [Armatimonadota bacterium]
MERKRKIIMAMSGGVDSSVGAALLVEQGYEVIGVTMHIFDVPETADMSRACCSLKAIEDARKVAAMLGIRHHVMRFQKEFSEKVVSNFIEEYREGRTPNPCVRCNKYIKFDTLMREAESLGADGVATGHYARVRYNPEAGRWMLLRGLDPSKDQSYVLYGLTQAQLARTLFPLGEMTKEETRQRALEMGLPVATKPESQDICFVPDRDYGAFLREQAADLVRPGAIVNAEGRKIGEHSGVAFFTIGQRKRLGVYARTPQYVLDIDARTNTVMVGEEEELFRRSLLVGDLNWIAFERLEAPLAVSARIRYNMHNVTAEVRLCDSGYAVVTFRDPQRAITAGQSAVFYQEDRVIGGGVIVRALAEDGPLTV